MATDEHKLAKDDLLRELEHLRRQLEDPHAEDISEDAIPLLLDRVEQVVTPSPADSDADELEQAPETSNTEADEAALLAAYHEQTDDLHASDMRMVEHAISLLKEDRDLIDDVLQQASPTKDQSPQPTEDQVSPVRPRPVAHGENPFLPKHIRDRLQERRQTLAQDIAEAATYFPAKKAPTPTPERSATDKETERKPRPPSADAELEALIEEMVALYLPRIEQELRTRLRSRLHNANPWPSESDSPR